MGQSIFFMPVVVSISNQLHTISKVRFKTNHVIGKKIDKIIFQGTGNKVDLLAHKLILESVLKLKNAIFFITNHFKLSSKMSP